MTDIQQAAGNAPAVTSKGQELWLHAETLAGSDLVPEIYRGKPANVFLAMDVAHRMGAGVFEVMQNLDIIKGKPGFSAKFKIGLANRSGKFRGPLRFRTEGEGLQFRVTCSGIDKETGEQFSRTVTMQMATDEGWTRNPKYKSIPEQMLTYRSGSFFIDAYCPEVGLGFPMVEEIEDVRYAQSEVTPPKAQEATAALNAILAPEEEKPEVPVEEPAQEEEAPLSQSTLDAFNLDDEEMA